MVKKKDGGWQRLQEVKHSYHSDQIKSNQIKSFISAEKKNNIYELIFLNHNM